MATIIMSAETVIAKCTTRIEQIRAHRDSENEMMIAQMIEHYNKGIINKILRRKPLSRDMAIKKLCENIFGWYPCNDGYAIIAKAEKLIQLAQLGDPLTISDDDLIAFPK